MSVKSKYITPKFKKESKRIKLIDGTLFDKIRIHEAVDGKKIKKKQLTSSDLKRGISKPKNRNFLGPAPSETSKRYSLTYPRPPCIAAVVLGTRSAHRNDLSEQRK